ncbi:MAG: glutamine-hydrolyzing GMP synthase [Victivallaceae bacterium]|nr:glutamine-hydrolyzing GMP synthase [Victivallaceae bacterium]
MSETIVVLDFGSQYSQLIARRIRECSVYSKIMPYYTPADKIKAENPKGIILSGGPSSVYADGAPKCDPKLFELGVPVLGICYGLQLMVHLLGGRIARGKAREYGKAMLSIAGHSALFDSLSGEIQVWMSHGDKVAEMPACGYEILGSSGNTEFCAVKFKGHDFYGIQFHPEVVHTPQGKVIIANFCKHICKCVGDWTMKSFIDESVKAIREKVGASNVILGLSGGVDSSVAAALIHKAIGRQLTCIFVNNGLLRKNEAEKVRDLFGRNFSMQLVYIDATDRFLDKLAGVSEPEKKRKIIGNEFVRVFDDASAKIENAQFLAQGTTYPDVIESVPIDGNPAAMIKSHHNVGGLPKDMKFKLLEPLSRLFKDEVREVGRQLGLPEDVVMRQPFPGPGLAVRHLGAVSRETLAILQDADAIVVDEVKKAGLYYSTWQTFAVFLPIRSVGVMGDERTYDYVIALRAVESTDGMTADWSRLPYELLGVISNRIINEVTGVNRVVYDITSKPPGTIEWE